MVENFNIINDKQKHMPLFQFTQLSAIKREVDPMNQTVSFRTGLEFIGKNKILILLPPENNNSTLYLINNIITNGEIVFTYRNLRAGGNKIIDDMSNVGRIVVVDLEKTDDISEL